MKRALLAVTAVGLAFAFCSWGLAGPGKEGKQAKKTVTGTIACVEAKQQTITIKLATDQQQSQTQAQSEPKAGKGKAEAGPLVFKVDAKTIIASPSAQQGEPGTFAALKAGQLVRVVYAPDEHKGAKGGKDGKKDPATAQGVAQKDAPVAQQQATQQTAQQSTPPKAEQTAQSGKQKEKKAPAAKRPLKALSIEVLAQAGPAAAPECRRSRAAAQGLHRGPETGHRRPAPDPGRAAAHGHRTQVPGRRGNRPIPTCWRPCARCCRASPGW